MLSAALIAVSLVIAYVIVVALVTSSTFALACLKPKLAVQDRRLRGSYNLLQDFLWLLFSAIGSYVAVAGSTEASPRVAALLLTSILLIVIWSNRREAKQRGMVHMLVTSVCIAIGVSLGYLVRIKQAG